MGVVAILITIAAMVVGIVGTLVPVLPGLWLVWLAMLGYAFVTKFAHISWFYLLGCLIGVLACQVGEFYAKAWGAKRYGAGKAGAWGAAIGSIVGLFILFPIGLLVGPFLGAFVGELLVGRSGKDAVRAGWGGVVGTLGSVALNFFAGLVLLIAFVVKVLV